jgi:hypothetical protein
LPEVLAVVRVVARLLDWLDDRILGHPCYRLCEWIEEHYG